MTFSRAEQTDFIVTSAKLRRAREIFAAQAKLGPEFTPQAASELIDAPPFNEKQFRSELARMTDAQLADLFRQYGGINNRRARHVW